MSASATPSEPKKIRWPDLAAYGIYFGHVALPNGETRLVMVDEDGAWRHLAKNLGFAQTRWVGVYSKADLNLTIPGYTSLFPAGKVALLTTAETSALIKPRIHARKDRRLSQLKVNERRLSWHPKRTTIADSVSRAVASAMPARAPAAPAAELSISSALRQTIFLGLNHQGQEVYEAGDGIRTVRSGATIISRENSGADASPLYLRANSEHDLILVAEGMVREIDAGKVLHSDDFVRFVEAVHGVDSAENTDLVNAFHTALDFALRNRMASLQAPSKEAFDEALRLHEGRPTFWREPGSWPTPLPIAVAMQALAAGRIASADFTSSPTVIDIGNQAKSHSWFLNASDANAGELPQHDVVLGGLLSEKTQEQIVSGIKVSRGDSELILKALAARQDKGITILTFTTERAGEIDKELRRILSLVGQNYAVAGLVDIDPKMFGPGNELAARILAIGDKRPEPDYTFAIAPEASVVYDYDSLWNWVETVRTAEFGESMSFGDDSRNANRWQAPYIASSQVSEPTAMSPRNLLGPARKALARLVERHGLGVDEYVCDRMGWTMEQLAERLDAEQVDAVAVGIQALEDGAGFVEADATGLGKGRVAATLAVYAKRKGTNVMFMTMKAELFSDFYRDVTDIGCRDELAKPFIVNSNVNVTDLNTGELIAKSATTPQAMQTLACGEFPKQHDIVLATYSQFNREVTEAEMSKRVQCARSARDLLAGTVDVARAILDNHVALTMPDYQSLHAGQPVTTALIESFERAQAASARMAGQEEEAKIHDRRADMAAMTPQAFAQELGKVFAATPSIMKHQWAYSDALKGALLILDESHVAAGELSQTGTNIRNIVNKSSAVAYSSATFAQEVKNFGLYSRIFPKTLNTQVLGETLARGGETMQEIVSAMLAEDGRLVRREHDLSGIEFSLVTDSRMARNEAWSDAFASVLSSIAVLSNEVGTMAYALNQQNPLPPKKERQPGVKQISFQYTNFSSKFYNLTRTFTMALRADICADRALESLRAGRKPVICVDNTMETAIRAVALGVDLDEEDAADGVLPSALDDEKTKASIKSLGRRVSFKDVLHAYVDVIFSAQELTSEGEKVISRKRITLENPKLQAEVTQIRKLIDSMPEIPLSPMDLVADRIRAAGYSIDEISGRKTVLAEDAEGNHVVAPRKVSKTVKADFNAGRLDVAMISRSGSTGGSMHASKTFLDQSQRELIELQPAASIKDRIQFWGRVNRKGQVCTPLITMLSSGLPAELRLITMQNAKLRKMSANISGNSDNSALDDSAPDILNHIGNEVCYRWMESNPDAAAMLGFDPSTVLEGGVSSTKWVDMLTGKLAMFPVGKQRQIYVDITTEFNAIVEQQEFEGRNPLKAAEYDLRATRTDHKVVQNATGSDSTFDKAVVASEISYTVSIPALDRELVMAEAAAGHAALKEAYGSNYADLLSQEYTDLVMATLPKLLPKRFNSVEHALADPMSNIVKTTAGKAEFLRSIFSRCLPGSTFTFGEGLTEKGKGSQDSQESATWYERMIVTGWKLPEENKLSFASYKLVCYSATTRRKKEVSLATLLAAKQFQHGAEFSDSLPGNADALRYYNRDLDWFFRDCSEPFSGTESRVVLEGNIYRAAELAESQRQGQAITYSDSKNVWSHAILMPRRVNMKNVMDFPVSIDSEELLLDAARSFNKDVDGSAVSIRDTWAHSGGSEKKSYELRVRPDFCALYVTVKESDKRGTMNWILKDTTIRALLTGVGFEGSRTAMVGKVVPGREEDFLRAFFTAMKAHNMPMYLPSDRRPWYNNVLQRRMAAGAPDDLAVQAAATSSGDEEMAALLATATP